MRIDRAARPPWGSLVLLVLLCFSSAPASGSELRVPQLPTVTYNLTGLTFEVSPDTLTVPRGIATQLDSTITGADALPPDATVLAVVRGPSFRDPLEIRATPGDPIFLPPFSLPGTHFVEDIRIDVDGESVLYATPSDVTINVLEELLVTNVTSRPLSLDEIRDLGIVYDDSSFKAFNFTIAFTTESRVIEIDYPVLVPLEGSFREARIINSLYPAGGASTLPGLELSNITIQPFMLEMVMDEGPRKDVPTIPGIIVIPGNVAFLNQFFSVFVAVSNQAPDGTPLVVRDLVAEVVLPPGADNVVGDVLRDPPFVPGEPEYDNPLRIAKTADGRENVKPVLSAGPDARPGTSDDVDELPPQGSGEAEFLVEGAREGAHVIDVEIRGTLFGLPGGGVEVTGRAQGAVVVRDPNFALTFIHPNVVRAGELYELQVELRNTSKVAANLVTVSIDPRNLTGARFIDPATASRLIEQIPAGDSASLVFELEALRTGQVNASTLELEDQLGIVSGRRLSLRAGVSEQGVPLSPDTLLLPSEVSRLRERAANVDLTFRALALLGQAHSISHSPRGSLPTGILPISSDTVVQRARELTEAAVRLEFSWRTAVDGSSEPLPEGLLWTLQDLYFDYLGAGFAEEGWDALYRDSRQARLFGAALAEVVGREAEALGAIDLIDLQRRWADTEAYRGPQITVMTQSVGPELPVVLSVVDDEGLRLGGSLDPQGGVREIPGADTLVFEQSGAPIGQLAVLTQVDAYSYEVTLEARTAGTFDLGIVVPAGDGVLRHLVFSSVTVAAGERLLVGIQPDLASPVELLQGGNVVAPSSEAVVVDGPPEVLAVVQDADPDVDLFGRVVALLFDEDVDAESAEALAAYAVGDAVIAMVPPPDLVDGNQVIGAQPQFGDRIVFVGLRDPVGPFVARTLDISGIRDLDGDEMDPVVAHPIVPDPEEGEGGQLTGRVLRSDGTPVPGAEITYFPSVLIATGCSLDAAITVKPADADGGYGIDFVARETCGDGRFRIRARDLETGEEGELLAVVRADAERMTLDIVLSGQGSLEGIVRDETGAPVADAQVRATSLTDSSQYVAATDQTGFYRIESISAGPIGLRVVGSAGQALASRSIVADTISRVDITLLSTLFEGVLTGEVRLPDGDPAANVRVLIREEGEQTGSVFDGFLADATADEAGTFRFEDLPVGSYQVRALDVSAGLIGDARIAVTDQNGADAPAFVQVLLNGTGSVAGTVYRRDGNTLVPVPGALVAGGLQLVTADESGRYFVPTVPVGVGTITALDPLTSERGSTAVTISSAGQASMGIDVVTEPLGTVSGQVFDPDGQPVSAGLDVILVVTSGGDLLFIRRAQTEAGGFYAFDRLELKDYPLTVMVGGAVANGLARLSKSVRDDVVDLRLVRPTGEITGHVIDETGLAVAAKVEISARVPNSIGQLKFRKKATIISDPDEGFWFGGLFLGPFSATASSFFAPESVTVSGSLTEGSPSADVTLVLSKNTATLSGCVLAPNGTQITPVLDGGGVPRPLAVFITSGRLRSDLSKDTQNPEPDGIRVDASTGCFVSSIPLPPDFYTVEVTDDRLGSPTFGLTAQVKTNIERGEDAEQNVTLLGLGSLTVEVVDTSGAAMPGVEVAVTRTTYPGDVREALLLEPTDVSPALFADLTEGPVTISARVSSEPGVDVGGRDDLRGFGGNATATVMRGGNQLVLVVVDAAGDVIGRFLQPDGVTPVPNAQVTLLGEVRPAEIPRMASDVTDADGAFAFVGVPVGGFSVEGFDAVTARRGRVEGEVDFDGQEVTVDLTLGPLGTARGTVLEADGTEPVAGAEVRLFIGESRTSPRLATAELDGSFVFESVPEAFSVTAISPDGLSGHAEGAIHFEGEVAELDVLLEGSGRVEGIVLDAFGNPVAGADIALIDEAENERSTQAGTDGADTGRFAFDRVPLSSYLVDARPPGALPIGDGGRTPVTLESAGEVADIDVTFEGTITVGVTVSGTQGSGALEVRLTSDGLFGGTAVPTTVENDVFLFEGIPWAPFTVTARQETLLGTQATATATLGQAGLPPVGSRLLPDIPLVLNELASVTGFVTDAAGTPVAGARVTAMAGTVNTLASTDATGRFEFIGLPFDVALALRAEGPDESLALFFGSIDVDGLVRDEGGGELAEVVLSLDEAPPGVADVSPLSGAVGVATGSGLVVTFSEPIDPGSVQTCPRGASADPPGFRLLESPGTIPAPGDPADPCDDSNVVPLEAVLSADGLTVTLTPLRELLGVTRHEAIVSRGTVDVNGTLQGGVRDLVGKPLDDDVVWSFVTRDNVPPAVTRVSPADGATDVPAESIVRITFSEAVDPRSVTPSSLVVTGPSGALSGQIDLILGNTVAVFTPTDAGGTRTFFETDATYQVSVSGVVDPAGNVQRVEDEVSVAFRTFDTTPPVVPSIDAPSGARPGELVEVPIEVADDDVASVEFYVDGVLVGVATTPSAPGIYTLTLTMPDGPVQIVARAIDSSGNVGSFGAPTVVGLLEDAPPAVAITQPAPGASVSQGTTVRFEVQASDDVAVTRVDGALSGVITASVGGPIASVPGVTIPFDIVIPATTPDGTLTFAAVVTDSMGQTSATATVSIIVADTTLPAVEIISPTEGELVTPGETLDVRVVAGDNVALASVSLEASGAATFFESRVVSPAANGFDESFQVVIPADASPAVPLSLTARAEDAAGNVSLIESISLNVLDVNIPVVSLAIEGGATEVLRGGTLTVTVSATDDTGVSELGFEAQGAFVDTRLVLVSPAEPASSTQFVINVPGTASLVTPLSLVGTSRDEAGNTATSAAASITVLANAPPTVSLTAPDEGSVVVSGSVLTLSADAADDLGVTQVAFVVDGVQAGIATLPPYSIDYTLPSEPGTRPVVVEAFASDNLGQTATDSVTITVSSDVTPPQVTTVYPADGAVGVSVASIVQVTFNEPIDPASVTAASFAVQADGAPVSGSFVIFSGNEIVVFTPDADLPFDATITTDLSDVIVDEAGNALADSDGNPLTQPLRFDFTTGSFGITSPTDGSEVVEKSELVLEARGSASLGIASVTFEVNGTELPAVSGTPFTTTFTTPSAETTPTLTIVAIARDGVGNEVAQDQVVVVVVVGLDLEPRLAGIPVGEAASLRLSLSSPASADLPITLSAVDPLVASVPGLVVLPAGEIELLVLVTGTATGSTTILASSSRGAPASIVSVSEPLAQQELTVLAPPTGVVLSAPPSAGQLTLGVSEQQTVELRLLTSPSGADLQVTVTSSDPAVVDVLGLVVVAAGELVAPMTLVTGAAGEATLTLRVGSEVRELTVFVGSPPPLGRTPAIVARPVGVALLHPSSAGHVILGASDQQTVQVRLLTAAVGVATPVSVTSSDLAMVSVDEPVVIEAGDQVATLTITTGTTEGQATLTLRIGSEVREITVFVGAPPHGRAPVAMARPVGVALLQPSSAGQVILGASDQQTVEVRLLTAAVGVATPVSVTSSDPVMVGVDEPVVIEAGDRVATLTITTGPTEGEAALTLRIGSEVREVTVFVGAPPPGRLPAIVAPVVGVEVTP